MKFNDQQRKAVYGTEKLIVISAGAGSGKTRVLTERYIYLCEQKLINSNHPLGASVDEIVALTFTEDAALEMKDRIRARINEKRLSAEDEQTKNYWFLQLEKLDHAIISTFHSFCQKILNDHSFEADVFPSTQVLDEVQALLMKNTILAELIEKALDKNKWERLFFVLDAYKLKTAVIDVYDKVRELDVGRGIREALQIDERVSEWRQLKAVALETFHQHLCDFFTMDHDGHLFTKTTKEPYELLKNSKDQHPECSDSFFRTVSRGLEKMKKKPHNTISKQCPELYELLEEWIIVRDLWLNSDDNQLNLLEIVLTEFQQLLEEFHLRYEQSKKDHASFDFSDLQQRAIKLLDDSEVSEDYKKTFKHFMIDEYQDTNPLQMKMLEKIKPNYSFIVGDGKQSIYRFRGADVRLMNRLVKQAKEQENASFIDMNTNYRTCDSIIKFINLMFEQEHIMGQKIEDNLPLYVTEYSPLTAARDGKGDEEKRVEYIKVSEEQDRTTTENQYIMIARRAVELYKNKTKVFDKDRNMWRAVTWEDMAILIPSRQHLIKIEKALEQYHIPFIVHSGVGFYDRTEVIEMISLLNWINRPFEGLYILTMLRGPLFGLSVEELIGIQYEINKREDNDLAAFIYEKKFIEAKSLSHKVKETLLRFLELFEESVPMSFSPDVRLSLLQLFEGSNLRSAFLMTQNGLNKVKNVEKLVDLLASMDTTSLEEMLKQLSIIIEASKSREGDADVEVAGGQSLSIMTIHGSKGLEFPVVFVPDLSRTIMSDKRPIRFDQDGLYVKFKVENEEELFGNDIELISPNFQLLSESARNQEIEESKRLLYVALTRARDFLILTTKDKTTSNTWNQWIKTAFQNTEQFHHIVSIKEGINEQSPVLEEAKEAKIPTTKIVRSIPITLSVSEILTYLKNRSEHYERYLLKVNFDVEENVDRYELEPSKVNSLKLGTLVHRICELLDQNFSRNEAYREALLLLDEDEDQTKYLDKIEPLIKSYQSKELGTSIENEWEFQLSLGDVTIIGEIDKVVQKNGRYVVIDIKTNYVRDNLEELISYYKPQLYLYKLAYEKEKNVKVEEMELFLLRDQKKGIYPIEYDPIYEQELLTKITDMKEYILHFKSNSG